MKRILIVILLLSACAFAQSTLRFPHVEGTPTAGNCVKFTDKGQLQDAGDVCGAGSGAAGSVVTINHVAPFADFGLVLQDCIDNKLPAAGGTCDASGITGAQSLSADLSLSKSHVRIILGSVTVAQGTHQVLIPKGVTGLKITGASAWAGDNTALTPQGAYFTYSGTDYAWKVVGDPLGVTWTRYIDIEDLGIQASSTTALGGIFWGPWIEMATMVRPRIRLLDSNLVGASIYLQGCGNVGCGDVAFGGDPGSTWSFSMRIEQPELAGGQYGIVNVGWNSPNVIGGRVQARGRTWGLTTLGQVIKNNAGSGYQAGDTLAVSGGTGGQIQVLAISVPAETFTVPVAPYQVTISNSPIFYTSDLVTYTSGGAELNRTFTVPPAAGQYNLDTGGLYTFAAADLGKQVTIAYTVNGNILGGGPVASFTVVPGSGYSAGTARATSGGTGAGFTVDIPYVGYMQYLKYNALKAGAVAVQGTACIRGNVKSGDTDLENCDMGMWVTSGRAQATQINPDGCCTYASVVFDGVDASGGTIHSNSGYALQVNGARWNDYTTQVDSLQWNSINMNGQMLWMRWEPLPLDVMFATGKGDTDSAINLHLMGIAGNARTERWEIQKSSTNDFNIVDMTASPTVKRINFAPNGNALFNNPGNAVWAFNYNNGSTGDFIWNCGLATRCAYVNGANGMGNFPNLYLGENVDAGSQFRLYSGTTTDHNALFKWYDYLGADKWELGRLAGNSVTLWDVANNINRLHFESGATNVTHISSGGTSAIKFNDVANNGSGGVEFYSGGATPAKVSYVDASGVYHGNVAGTAAETLWFNALSGSNTTSDRFISPSGMSGSELAVAVPVMRAGTISGCRVTTSIVLTGTMTLTVSMRKAAAATPTTFADCGAPGTISLLINAASGAATVIDATNSCTVAAGDMVDMKVHPTNTATASFFTVGCLLQ